MAWARTGFVQCGLEGPAQNQKRREGSKTALRRGGASSSHFSAARPRDRSRRARSRRRRTGCCVFERAGGYREFIRNCGSKRASSVESTQLPRTSPSAAMMLVTVNAMLDPANKLTDKGPAI